MSRLAELRKTKLAEASRYTQGALAEVAGVSRPTYRQLEKHPENMTQRQQEAVAAYFGMPVDDIFLRADVN